MATKADEEFMWTWPRFAKHTLIGPVPMVKNESGWYHPDYRHPGVAERVAVEVDFHYALHGDH